LALDNKEVKKEIFQRFGWHFLAKEVADFCNMTFFDVMYLPAVDVAGMAAIIHYKAIYTNG
jgi:hypothetical protein